MRGVNEIIIDKSFAIAAIKWRRTLDYNTVGGPIKGPAIKGPFPKKMKCAFVP